MRLLVLCWVLLMGISHVFTSPIADGTNTQLVRPSDWNSAHAYTLQDAVSLSGNTAGVLANISSGTFYLAGGNNVTLSQDGNSVTVSGPHISQFLTTAMASNRGTDFVQATAAFAGTSASGTINSTGISVSIGPYLTTAMASNRGTDFVQATAGFNGTNCSGTIASNSISVSVGNYLTTAMASNRGSDFVAATAAFAGTNASGTIASNGISVSVEAPGGASPKSFYMWPDEIQNSSAWQVSGSTSHVQPVYLPFPLSVSYLRIPLTLSCVGSQAATATANNHTRGMTMSSTINIAFYSQDVGGSSRSLETYATGSASWVQRATIQAGAVGSNWSSGHTISYPNEGGNTNFTTSAAATSASFTMNSTQLTNFTNLRFFDIPFATSLSEGAYWFVYGSSTSISTSGNANISTLRILASNFVATQVNQAVNLLGAATNSSNHFRNGLGSFTTNTIGTIMNSIALASISTSASHPILYFQMIRQA